MFTKWKNYAEARRNMKLLLVDCDGTIREPDSGEKFIQYPQDQRIIRGADKAIASYSPSEWTIVGITNQGGVAAGHKSLSDCCNEQRYTLELFPQISAIYFCPDYNGWDSNVLKHAEFISAEAGKVIFELVVQPEMYVLSRLMDAYRLRHEGAIRLAIYTEDALPQYLTICLAQPFWQWHVKDFTKAEQFHARWRWHTWGSSHHQHRSPADDSRPVPTGTKVRIVCEVSAFTILTFLSAGEMPCQAKLISWNVTARQRR